MSLEKSRIDEWLEKELKENPHLKKLYEQEGKRLENEVKQMERQCRSHLDK